MEVYNAVGRRKAAVARVFLREGKGNIVVNGRKLEEYFTVLHHQFVVKQPLEAIDKVESFDIKVTLDGGGIKGQAEALRLGIARALLKVNPEYRSTLKPLGFLTRDPRVVERKKPGQKKARKRFQFSKR
ncbi:MAG: 30S ribosomal protein S9 [Bacteroidales bacterium]|jgi:small subunit ribosomal protein S9|nr:30S ribosomal protein S9 [Flavobacterium piscis]HOK37128.1 30S ribosomal protein S9 [Bacteroidales bacterium]HOL97297.1 30S ribosomal protein S9 [Bacteroidales bacterium]HPD22865.1 30S ribosomal protein S9 [Bacteroidales bacterium]HRT00548.1 30S ribosomal protein S9 [Bacteroidales bacterium]